MCLLSPTTQHAYEYWIVQINLTIEFKQWWSLGLLTMRTWCCICQEKDLKLYMEECGNILNINNVKVVYFYTSLKYFLFNGLHFVEIQTSDVCFCHMSGLWYLHLLSRRLLHLCPQTHHYMLYFYDISLFFSVPVYWLFSFIMCVIIIIIISGLQC